MKTIPLCVWAALLTCACHAPAAAKSAEEMRVFGAQKCPVTQSASIEVAPLVGAALKVIAPVLVEKAIDAAAAAATQAGRDDTVQSALATWQGNLYRFDEGRLAMNRMLGCLVFVRGSFGNEAQRPPEGWSHLGIGAVAALTGLNGHPAFYMEAILERTPDRAYIRIVPQYLDYRAPIASSFLRSAERGVSVAMSFTLPGADKVFGDPVIAFPGLEPGTILRKAYLAGHASHWFALPAPTERTNALIKDELEYAASRKANDLALSAPKPARPSGPLESALERASEALCATLSKEKKEDEACPRQLAKDRAAVSQLQKKIADENLRWEAEREKLRLDNWRAAEDEKRAAAKNENKVFALDELQPFNLNVTLNETAPGNKLLKFVGEVLGGAKTDVAAVVKKKLAEDHDALQSAAADAADAALLAAAEAKAAVDSKLLKIAHETEESNRAQMESELPTLKIKANIAYRKAGLAEPYPDVRL
ncbi:hypothetical protein [Massilia sp. TS11]|uniref:hypothetical protein n=1 Tax=Massilia sp. TS11 TaxID=2908003 RepID=UPI001EDAA1C8|nr:hypothetical protein [Massilia sp. TS11]MCG2586156.1 hypothetical protein [Massilia sp. TS11]